MKYTLPTLVYIIHLTSRSSNVTCTRRLLAKLSEKIQHMTRKKNHAKFEHQRTPHEPMKIEKKTL